MLALSYSLDVAPREAQGELTSEEVDAYVRLDKNIQALLQELRRKFGEGNYLLALSGTGYTHYRRPRLRGAEARTGSSARRRVLHCSTSISPPSTVRGAG